MNAPSHASRLARSLLFALALVSAEAFLPSCLASYGAGTAVTVSVRGELEGALDSSGREVRIDAAYLDVAEVELVPCMTAARFAPSLRSVAYAHGSGGSALHEAHFVPLHTGSHELGVLSPAAGRYCGLRVTVRPTDAETEGVAEAGVEEGLAVYVAGAWQHGTDGGEMRASSPGNAVLELALDAPLEISSEHASAALEIAIDLAGAFAATDASGDPVDVGLDLVAHLDEHTRCERVDGTP